MAELFKHHNDAARFFSHSSIFTHSKEQAQPETKDPQPFGLNFQEDYPQNQTSPKQAVTMNPCPTSTPLGSDGGVDVDIEF